MNAGQCPATRGSQTCASIGPHARHVWTDPQPAVDQELLELAARALAGTFLDDPDAWMDWRDEAEAVIAVVRAWDAERAITEEHTCDFAGVYLTRWHCPMPAADRPYMVVREHWSEDFSTRDVFEITYPQPVQPADFARASTGVPTCHGEAYVATEAGDDVVANLTPCTLPLGHHGGCR